MPKDDSLHQSRKQLEAFVRVGLAGRIAEEIVFDDVTTGAANDIQQVTQIARRMVKMFGMSDSVGMVNYGDDGEQPFLGYAIASGRDYSDDTASKLDAEIKRIIDVAYQETRELLDDHRDELDALAEALLSKETVEREEILRILGMEDDTDEYRAEISGQAPARTRTGRAERLRCQGTGRVQTSDQLPAILLLEPASQEDEKARRMTSPFLLKSIARRPPQPRR